MRRHAISLAVLCALGATGARAQPSGPVPPTVPRAPASAASAGPGAARGAVPVAGGPVPVPAAAASSAASAAGASAAAPAVGGPVVVETRWRPSFEAFDAADQAHLPAPGGVLFVGSSSIRLWDDLEKVFGPEVPVTKRGFGGSRMEDCARYARRLVLPYRPRLVVVYAGDNDLADGRTPEQVEADFRHFVDVVRSALPETRIAYLSIKPSPLRAALMPAIHETNTRIAAYAAATSNLDYIDVYSHMLDADGRPRTDLYRDDRLHLNAQGYALWKQVIASHLR